MKTSEDFYEYLMEKILDDIVNLEHIGLFSHELSIKVNTEIAKLKLEAAQRAQEICMSEARLRRQMYHERINSSSL